MVKCYSFVVFISLLFTQIFVRTNAVMLDSHYHDPGRVHGTSVYTNREHGLFSRPCCLSCYIQVSFQRKKIANMMSLQTRNKLSYTAEFVITYEKEKMEKGTVAATMWACML